MITVILIRPIRTVIISIAHQFASNTVTAIPAVELAWWAAFVWIFIWPVSSSSWQLQRQLAIKFIGIYFYVKLRKLLFHKWTSFCILMPWLRHVITVNMCQQQSLKLIALECLGSTPHFKAACHSMQFSVLLQGVSL